MPKWTAEWELLSGIRAVRAQGLSKQSPYGEMGIYIIIVGELLGAPAKGSPNGSLFYIRKEKI